MCMCLGDRTEESTRRTETKREGSTSIIIEHMHKTCIWNKKDEKKMRRTTAACHLFRALFHFCLFHFLLQLQRIIRFAERLFFSSAFIGNACIFITSTNRKTKNSSFWHSSFFVILIDKLLFTLFEWEFVMCVFLVFWHRRRNKCLSMSMETKNSYGIDIWCCCRRNNKNSI